MLFPLFLLTQLYALNIHFPHPPSGLVYPKSIQLLKLFSVTGALLAWTPVFTTRSSAIAVPASIFFAASLIIFAWTAAITSPRKLSVIFGRVTPEYVISNGPFTYVRHPTYVSYALGWMGAAVVVLYSSIVSQGGNVWISSAVRAPVMVGVVAGLFWLYQQGAVLEEEQFLAGKETVMGKKVGEDVRVEYLSYMRRVPWRWIPGVI
jgi:protein-S-isoprenylcysteine O-methyltransferase Ste14